jgi:RNA recognition motif-containing protein
LTGKLVSKLILNAFFFNSFNQTETRLGYSFGYGFVEYINEDDARKAIESLNGYQIEHKRLKVALARPNCEETKNTNLYIRNIPSNYDETQLHDLFAQYGEVIQVRLLRDQNTAFSRRIGFVIMATKQLAQLAIQNLDNTVPPNGGNEPIYVKYADEDGKKKHSVTGGANSRNNHHNNHHHNHQNNYSNNFSNLNYMNQQGGFGYNNNFMMNSAGQNSMPGGNSFPNLGKMKSNRSGGHQNRYNPLAGNNAQANLASGVLSQPGNAGNASNYNNWNMAQGMQTAYNNFGTPNHLIGNSAGFDNIIGGSAGAGTTSAYSNHHHNIHSHPMQQHNPNSYLNINTAAMVAAVANLGGSSSNGNLLDLSGGGSLGVDNKLSGSAGNNMASGNTSNVIYVYGIGPQATESDLYSLFSNCGRIVRVNVIKNPKTTQCKGYGFVMFETYEEAYYAVHSMNGYMYHNRPLQVSLTSFS